jgi:hypothetical protein
MRNGGVDGSLGCQEASAALPASLSASEPCFRFFYFGVFGSIKSFHHRDFVRVLLWGLCRRESIPVSDISDIYDIRPLRVE